MLTSFGSGPLRENLLFYLATQPSQFGEVVEQIHRAGLLHKEGAGWQRIVVEKPFGHDLASAHDAEPRTDPLRPRAAGLPH